MNSTIISPPFVSAATTKCYPPPLSVGVDRFEGMKSPVICPNCQTDQVKEIIYGLPDIENFDFEKYEVGGCCVTQDDPRYLCL